jgi:glycosyltransferase involved in cell wall biosynthesis
VALDRLLITACLAGNGGGEVALLRHLRYSTVPPDRITVAILNDGPLVENVRALGIRCEMIGRPGRDGSYPGLGERLQIAWRLASLLRQTATDAVLSFGIHDLSVAILARRLATFRLGWRSQGEVSIFDAHQEPGREARRLVASAKRHVDAVVPTTRWDADTLQRWGIPSSSLETVYLGVDDEWFDTAAEADDGVLHIVMSGRLIPWKGQHTLIAALAQIAGTIPVEAWIVGEGDPRYKAELEAEVLRAGLSGVVWFAGHRTDVRELMAKCHVAVHCSEREPFGLVVIEAMAAGLAVVASDVQGPREIITPGIDGYLVPPANPDRLAERLVELARQPDRRRALAAAGRNTARTRFRASLNVPEAERAAFTTHRRLSMAQAPRSMGAER